MKKFLVSMAILLSAGLSASAVAADAKAGKVKSAMCAGCHGADGNSPIASNPKLNGQSEKYLAKQLTDFTSSAGAGGRSSPIMGGMAASLNASDRADVAAYFAAQETHVVAAPAVSKDDLAIGERIYRAGNEATGVPACIGCHGPKGNGNAGAGWPRLAGQHAAYLTAQIKAFREASQYPDDSSKGRRNDGDAQTMRDATAHLNDREVEALAAYLQGLH